MLQIARVRVYPLAIPMRIKFEHAAASRNVADPIVVELAAAPPYAGTSGWGETLARAYVTGETTESVVETIRDRFSPIPSEFRAASFEKAVRLADQLPYEFDGSRAHAARAAVELAWLDLAGRVFDRPMCDVTVVAFPASPATSSQPPPRYSGIVVGRGSAKLKVMLRAQRAYGLRDFKIKVAIPDWQRRLQAAHEVLRRSISRGIASLRVDANGGWTLHEALDAIPLLEACNIAAIEQPLPVAADAQLPQLTAATRIPIMPDESLVSLADAERLIGLGARILNIRIAKVGGLLPALRMAHLAAARGCGVQLGCLVGETSILTAAGHAFVQAFRATRFLEGAFGKWLLRRDVTLKSTQFGYGGRFRPRTLDERGLGIEVSEAMVIRAAANGRAEIELQ